eukprot:11637108-Alexandrium_andersonii.AAC.1
MPPKQACGAKRPCPALEIGEGRPPRSPLGMRGGRPLHARRKFHMEGAAAPIVTPTQPAGA